MIHSTRKTNIHFNYFVGDLLIVRNDYVKDLGIVLDNKVLIYRHGLLLMLSGTKAVRSNSYYHIIFSFGILKFYILLVHYF
jgi:hypothetical protein